MINAEIEASVLKEKLTQTCPDADIDLKLPATDEVTITINNPTGGLPINIAVTDFDDEFKVIYCKTPRFFSTNKDGVDALLKAVADYINGDIAYMNIISTGNNAHPRDRLVHVNELPQPDQKQLALLCIKKDLLSETDLNWELQGGSSVCINFWNTHKNYCYKLLGGKIIKVEQK